MKNSYTIKELIGLFLNKIWIIIIVTITGGLLSFGFSKMFLHLNIHPMFPCMFKVIQEFQIGWLIRIISVIPNSL